MNDRPEDPDRADVRLVLAGDVAAFENIVRRWQGPLVNLAYRYCRHRGVAEELAQDAFLRAFRFLDRWRDQSAFSTWLFTVATNVYRSHARRVRPPEISLDEPGPPLAGEANPAADVEQAQMAEAVRRMVLALPAKYRDALVLFYFQDMDITEAARSLDLPEGTVKARLFRGRKMLEKKLRSISRPLRSAEVLS